MDIYEFRNDTLMPDRTTNIPNRILKGVITSAQYIKNGELPDSVFNRMFGDKYSYITGFYSRLDTDLDEFDNVIISVPDYLMDNPISSSYKEWGPMMSIISKLGYFKPQRLCYYEEDI